MSGREGFATGFEGRPSIQLSYGHSLVATSSLPAREMLAGVAPHAGNGLQQDPLDGEEKDTAALTAFRLPMLTGRGNVEIIPLPWAARGSA